MKKLNKFLIVTLILCVLSLGYIAYKQHQMIERDQREIYKEYIATYYRAAMIFDTESFNQMDSQDYYKLALEFKKNSSFQTISLVEFPSAFKDFNWQAMNLLFNMGEKTHKGNLNDQEIERINKFIEDLQFIVDSFGEDFFETYQWGDPQRDLERKIKTVSNKLEEYSNLNN